MKFVVETRNIAVCSA